MIGDPDEEYGTNKSPPTGRVCVKIVLFLPYMFSSLIVQLVKNSPAMQETLIGFLGWEDPLEKA